MTKPNTRLSLLACALLVGSTALTSATPASAATAASCIGADTIALTNAGFESPAIAARSYRIMSESNVPGWSTTASDRQIELWSAGFGNVTPAEGQQFAELNANMTSALYQDVTTTPGARVTWSLAHRGRSGVDTMRVVIGRPGGTLAEVARMSDGTSGWGRHSGTYVVPAGQTTTRFAFEAVSTAGGNPTVGNFLDDISFGTPACIELTKQVTVLGDAVPGGRLRWSITATNIGGSPATGLTITDSAPLHTAYAPGSLRVHTGPRAGSVTDASDADAGSAGGGKVSWTPFGASNIAGRINPQEKITVSFETIIADDAAGAQVSNRADARYTADGTQQDVESNQATVEVAEVADVYVHKLFDAESVTAVGGVGPANFTIVVGNLGPFGADGITLTDPLPDGLSVDSTAITIDGSPAGSLCSISGTPATLQCLIGDLAPGAIRSVVVPATFTKVTPGIFVVENAAEAWPAGTYDINGANNLSTAQLVFDPGPAADVTVKVAAPVTRFLPGERATWVIETMNTTELGLAATGVSTTVQLPAALEDVDLPVGCTLTAPTTATCSVGTLAALGSTVFSISGRIAASAPADQSLTLTATVSADDGCDSDATNNVDAATVSVDRPGRVEVRKVALDPVTQARTRFEVTVVSVGEFEARDVVLTDVADAAATAVSFPDDCTVEADASVRCELGTLEPGDARTLLFEFTTTDLNSALTNTATATGSNTGDPVSASAKALPIIPEYSERSIPGGLPPAPPPPPMAFTGASGHPLSALALLLLAAGVALLTVVRRRRS